MMESFWLYLVEVMLLHRSWSIIFLVWQLCITRRGLTYWKLKIRMTEKCVKKGKDILSCFQSSSPIVETKTSSDNPVCIPPCRSSQSLQTATWTITPDVNSTRLKEKLLAGILEPESHKKGRNILLAFKKYIGSVLSEAYTYSEAINLAKAANIVRGHMIDHKSSFAGTFHEGYVKCAIPATLLQFSRK